MIVMVLLAPPLVAVIVIGVKLGPSVRPVTSAEGGDPKRFLLRIMNDDTVALALRIEAAKALLQHSSDHRPKPSD